MIRKIIHVDMDAFFASVEQRDRPELRGRPLAVGGDPTGRGVVAAASYEAREYGVHSAMPAAQALRLCPHIVFLRSDIARYREVSRQIFDIFHDITPLVEGLSLDEAYLDVTENALEEPLAGKVALHIKRRIRDELGLTASAGVAPNKLVAKIASDMRKPDGLVIIPPKDVEAFIAALPVEKIWGVGPATAKRLHNLGIRSALDIRHRSEAELANHLGRFGLLLHRLSRGDDDRKVTPEREPKSRGSERTFEQDVRDLDTLEHWLQRMSQGVAASLRRMERPGRTVILKLRYSDFTTITRSRTLPEATVDPTRIATTAVDLLRGTDAGERPVRLVGVSVGGLVDPTEPLQLELPLADGDTGGPEKV